MASLYRRKNSPFWWIKYRHPASGKLTRESTKIQVGTGANLIAARKLRAEFSLQEQTRFGTARASGWEWVERFLEAHYTRSEAGLRRKRSTWKTLLTFLQSQGIQHPHQLQRQHCLLYTSWRRSPPVTCGVRGAGRGTMLYEIASLSRIMREAIALGFASANPCSRLGLERATHRVKPELTEAEISQIRERIAEELARGTRQAEFMRVSFEIALAQGCRLAETYLHLYNDIDLDRGEITFNAKGGKRFTTALNPTLAPLIHELRARGQIHTYQRPRADSAIWTRCFRNKWNLPHLCFHCTRVTVISRMERAGAPESVVMKMVGHASTTVHRVYRRVPSEELSRWFALGTPGAGTPGASGNPDAPATTPPPPPSPSDTHA